MLFRVVNLLLDVTGPIVELLESPVLQFLAYIVRLFLETSKPRQVVQKFGRCSQRIADLTTNKQKAHINQPNSYQVTVSSFKNYLGFQLSHVHHVVDHLWQVLALRYSSGLGSLNELFSRLSHVRLQLTQ